MSIGLVYFIIAVGDGVSRVKIGWTGGDPVARLKALQSGSPVKLNLCAAFPGNKAMERRLHETFAPVRLHGEWFELKGKLADFIVFLVPDEGPCRPVDMVWVLHAIEHVVLAEKCPREGVDADEYLASADTRHWEWMRVALAASDASEATVQ